QVEQSWEGMKDMPAFWENDRRSLRFEGDGDGDAGFGSLSFNAGRWTGWVHFPEGGPEGIAEDQRIDLGCSPGQVQNGTNPNNAIRGFACGMSDQRASPYFTFILKIQDQQVALSYVRNAFLGSEEVAVEQSWP